MISSFLFFVKFFCFFFNKGHNVCNSNTRCVKMNGISCRFQRRHSTVAVLIVTFGDFFFNNSRSAVMPFQHFPCSDVLPFFNRSNQKIFDSAFGKTTVPISRLSMTIPPAAICCCWAASVTDRSQGRYQEHCWSLHCHELMGHIDISHED